VKLNPLSDVELDGPTDSIVVMLSVLRGPRNKLISSGDDTSTYSGTWSANSLK